MSTFRGDLLYYHPVQNDWAAYIGALAGAVGIIVSLYGLYHTAVMYH